jgi:GNAT superfamily N-acetyltransferase
MPRIMEIAEQFWRVSPWASMGLVADDAAIAATVERCMEQGGCFIGEVGAVMGQLAPVWASPESAIAVELAWWGPGEGRALREAFEAWAVRSGAVGVVFSTLGAEWDSATARKLGRAGYRRFEQSWIKESSEWQ